MTRTGVRSPASQVQPDQMPPKGYAWATNGRVKTSAHLIDPKTFMSDYEALCGVSAYMAGTFEAPINTCTRCAAIARKRGK